MAGPPDPDAETARVPEGYPARWEFDTLLSDGGTVHIRPILPSDAEAAFIVDDAHQGRGLATVLLEYLAVAARENGLDGLTATVLPTNRRMLGVFRDVGFQVTSAFEEGVIEVRLGIEPTEEGRSRIEARERRSEAASVSRLLSPGSIAVIGARSEEHT